MNTNLHKFKMAMTREAALTARETENTEAREVTWELYALSPLTPTVSQKIIPVVDCEAPRRLVDEPRFEVVPSRMAARRNPLREK